MEYVLKTMERLVNQNAEDEIFQDFKCFEDIALINIITMGRGHCFHRGALLRIGRIKNKVTSLCWNPRYNDVFAVGYGSYDFTRQGTGIVCCFSLKNTSYPEYVISTESGCLVASEKMLKPSNLRHQMQR